MKVTVDRFSKEATAFLEIAQQERVVVTRRGKPVAVLVGLENKDKEDLVLERDEDFWETIHQRRKESKTVSLEEIKRRYGLDASKRGKKSASKAATSARKSPTQR